jgi:hypothetical protein
MFAQHGIFSTGYQLKNLTAPTNRDLRQTPGNALAAAILNKMDLPICDTVVQVEKQEEVVIHHP